MKKILFLMAILLPFVFSSCGDDKDEFNYPLETLYGTWQISGVKTSESGSYISWPYETTTATFSSNGSYVGRGYFGNGSGTYKAKGNRITTYVDGETYLIYDVISLSGNTCELKVTSQDGSASVYLKCTKH